MLRVRDGNYTIPRAMLRVRDGNYTIPRAMLRVRDGNYTIQIWWAPDRSPG